MSRKAVLISAVFLVSLAGCDMFGDSSSGPNSRPVVAHQGVGAPDPSPSSPQMLEAKIRDVVQGYAPPTSRQRLDEVPRVDSPPEGAKEVKSEVRFADPASHPEAGVKHPTTLGSGPVAATTQPVPAVANAPAEVNIAGATTAPAANVAAGSELDALVRARAAKDPRDVSAQMDVQMLDYLRELQVPSQGPLSGLPREDQDIIASVMDALVNFRANVRADPNAPFDAKVRPLADLADHLRVRSDLSIPVVVLTSAVRSFGNYDPLPATLSAQAYNDRVLYYEVKNFSSRLEASGMWETRLSAQVCLYDEAGRLLWQTPTQEYHDVCRNRRNDFFISPKIRIPPMVPGHLRLKVTLTDLNIGRMTEGELRIESKATETQGR
jgi:hypothetical protein